MRLSLKNREQLYQIFRSFDDMGRLIPYWCRERQSRFIKHKNQTSFFLTMWFHRENRYEILLVDQCLTALLDKICKFGIDEPKLELLEYLNVDLYFSRRIEAEVRLGGLINLLRLANCYKGIIIETYNYSKIKLQDYHVFYAFYHDIDIKRVETFCRVFEPTLYIHEKKDGFVLIHEGLADIPELPTFLASPEILVYHDRYPRLLDKLPCNPHKAAIRLPNAYQSRLDPEEFDQLYLVLKEKIISTEAEDPKLLDILIQ